METTQRYRFETFAGKGGHMKTKKMLVTLALLIAAASVMQAAIVETLSINLSPITAGSTLSGNFTLSDSPASGDSAPVTLTFSDPQNYSPTTLNTIVRITEGTPTGFAVVFDSPITFTYLNGSTLPINTRDVSLTPFAFARCASFPCMSTGGIQDRSPAVFTSTYTISPVAASAVPEPASGLLVPAVLLAFALRRRLA